MGQEGVLAGPRASREHHVGIMAFFAALGQSVGPALSSLVVDRTGLRQGLWAAAAVSVVAAAMAAQLPAVRPQGGDGPLLSSLALVREPAAARALGAGVVSLSAYELIMTYWPLYLTEKGYPPETVGLLLTVRAVAAMAVRPFTGLILKRLECRRAVGLCLALGGLTTGLFGVPAGEWLLAPTAFLSGLSLNMAQPLTLVMMADAVPEGSRPQALALRLIGNCVGSALGAFLLGALAVRAGYGPVFWVAGAGLVLSARWVSAPARMAARAWEAVPQGKEGESKVSVGDREVKN